MKKLLPIALLAIAWVSLSQADETYLGKLSANPYGTDSTSNAYGAHGSEYSTDSINNEYGEYGSQYSNNSATNPYATGSPYKADSPNNPYGEGISIYGDDG